MRVVFETIAVAFSIFSAIPMPRFDWNEKNMRYMLLGFPFIGVVTGVLCVGWLIISDYLRMPAIMMGAGFTLIPVLITGGIHLDGYVDTCDALASHGDHEKKAEILRDPHIGAFAAIRVGAYFVLMLAVWSGFRVLGDSVLGELYSDSFFLNGFFGERAELVLRVIMIFTLSRILSGLAVVTFKRTEKEDLLHVFYNYADAARVKKVLIVMDGAVCVILFLTGVSGMAMALTAHLVYLFYHRQCIREFGGVSGDQAGWFLVQAEKWMAIVMVGAQYVLPWIMLHLF